MHIPQPPESSSPPGRDQPSQPQFGEISDALSSRHHRAAPRAVLYPEMGQAFLSFGLCFLALVGFFFFVIPGVVLTLAAILHAILVIHGRNADERTRKVVDAIENQAV